MPKVDHLEAVVLDTHVWIWIANGDSRARAFEHFRGRAIISAISLWEVSMLVMKERLSLLPDLRTWLIDNTQAPVRVQALDVEISATSCELPDFHGDPADRQIVATALTLGLPLVTADVKISDWQKTNPSLQLVRV